MAEILIRHYIYGIILFTLLITAGVSLITDISTTEGNLLTGDELISFNNTFNKKADLEASVRSIETNINGTTTGSGVLTSFGVLGSLINSGWNALKLMFGSLSFMNSVFGGVANTFGIPVWLTTFIGLFVTILIGFGIFTVIFQREV